MQQLTLQRIWFTDLSVCGELLVDGEFECYTLEPPNRLEKPRCIPAGFYRAHLAHSMHFERETIWVENVSGYEDIEFHPGNYPYDTSGCILVGAYHSEDFLGGSVAAFGRLMEKLERQFELRIVGGTPLEDTHGREVLDA